MFKLYPKFKFFRKGSFKVHLLLGFGILLSGMLHAQQTYYSKASATNFASAASWGINLDGSGAAPGSVSTADNFYITNGSNMVLNASVGVRRLDIEGGSLTVSANTLTVSVPSENTTELYIGNGGTLSVTGGTVNINGGLLTDGGSVLSQTGGNINLDPNNGGVLGTSYAGVPLIFGAGADLTTANSVSLTGGTFTYVDPPVDTYWSFLSYGAFGGLFNVTNGHTFRFGDGVSTDATNWTALGTDFGVFTRPVSNYALFPFGNVVFNRHTTFGRNNHQPLLAKGSVTINPSGTLLVRATTGTTFAVVGNFTNNGIFEANGNTVNLADFGYANAAVNLFLFSGPQTIGGTGSFRNAQSPTAPTANFVNIQNANQVAAGVSFATPQSLLSGSNQGTVSGNLSLNAGCRINTNGGTFIVGINAVTTGAIPLIGAGSGFTAGSVVRRWVSTSSLTLSATAITNFLPFLGGEMPRYVLLNRSAALTNGGWIQGSHSNVSGLTPSVFTDLSGSYAVDQRTNGSWSFSTGGGLNLGAATLALGLTGEGLISTSAGSFGTAPRLIQASSAAATHTAASGTAAAPVARRQGLIASDLTSLPHYIGIGNADLGLFSISNGPWESGATWSTGSAPIAGTDPIISAGTTVTVNAVPAQSSTVKIEDGGTLTVSGSTLTVSGAAGTGINVNGGGTLNISGGTLNLGPQDNSFCDRLFSMNGHLTVSSGNLNIAGRYFSSISSKHTQTGGNIKVDGNAGGVAGNSVASGLPIVTIASTGPSDVSFTGGTFTIVDPHANAVATNALTFSNSNTGKIDVSSAHTFNFGDGVSSDNGGNAAAGFRVTTTAASFAELGTVLIQYAGGTNRFVTHTNTFLAKNLTVDIGAEYRQNAIGLGIAGNLVVDGTGTFNGTLTFGQINAAGNAFVSSALAQSISGIGIIQNALAGPTGNFSAINVYNSGSGLTLNLPITMTGALGLVTGRINTTSTNILTMTSTSGNVLNGVASAGYVNGPMRRVVPANVAIGTFAAVLPVGKSGPNWLIISPATSAAGTVTIEAEVFNTNSGTSDGVTLSGLNSGRRWDISTSGPGAITSYNATLYDNNISNGNSVAGSASAAGTYSALSSTSNFTPAGAALPNALTTGADVTGSVASFLGFGPAGPLVIGAIAVQQQTGTVSLASSNNSILRLNIPVTGSVGTISLDGLVFTYVGDPADIDLNGVSVWTGNAVTPIAQVGSGVSLSGATATFSGLGINVGIGNNYIWIRLNTSPGATLGNTIDGRVNTGGLTFSSTGPVVLSPPYPSVDLNPAGDRLIDYCAPTYVDGCGGTVDNIANVVLNGSNINLANASGCAASPYYTFFNAVNKPDLQQGITYTLSVTVGSDATQFIGVWFDFNRNGLFEASEFFASAGSAGANGTANISVTIPPGATLGDTRMRIRGGDDVAVTSGVPCGASASTYGETEDYIVTIIAPIPCTSIGSWPASTTTTSASSLCTGSSASFDLTVPMPPSTGLTYQLQLGGVDFGAPSSLLPFSRALTTSGTYRIVVKCNGGAVLTSTGVVVTVLNPLVSSSTGATRCGPGTLTLTANPSVGSTIKWYNAPTGGIELSSGNSFVTPSLNVGTTTYYAGAQSTFGVENVGPLSALTPTQSAFTLAGIRFNASSSLKINTAVIYPVGTGQIVLGLQNSSGVFVAETAPISIVGGTGTAVTINVGLDIPAGVAQRLLLKSYSGTITLARGGVGSTYPINSPSGVFSITAGWNASGPFTNYFYFYDLNISRVCLSNRVAVNAVVTTPPPINFVGASTNICSGVSQTVTASGSGYTTYNWSPGGAGASKVLAPSSTTSYTVTASGGGCNNVRAFTIKVRPTPTNPVISSEIPAGGICKGATKSYTGSSVSSGGDYVVFRGDFNEGNTDGYQFQSSGALPTNWELAPGPISYNADFSNFSPNGSPFIWVNSDILGPGSGVARIITPSMSTVGLTGLSLRFTHAFRTANPANTGTVQYSVDNGVTWSSDVYTTSPDLSVPAQSWIPTGFLVTTSTVALPVGAENKPNLKIRFTYNYSWDYYWFVDDIEVFTPAVNQYQWSCVSPFAGIPNPQQIFNAANTAMVATPTEGGTFNIVLSTRNTAGCEALSTASSSVNVSDIILSPSNSGPQRSNQTISFNANATGGFLGYGYVWKKLPDNVTVVNTNATWSIPFAPASASGTYQVTVTDGQGCSSTQTTEALVFDALVWNGSVDGNWNNPSNWTPSIAPVNATSCTDPIVDNVVITNSGTSPVYPNVNQYVQNMVVESGVVTFTNNINVCNSLGGGVGTTGSIAGTGNVTLVGTGTTLIGGKLKTDRLFINKSAGQVRFQGTLTITDLLSINPANNATINVEPSGNVILASTATQTGKIGPIPVGTSVSVTAPGKFTVQRFLPFTVPTVGNNGNWFFLGTAINGKDFRDWADDFRMSGYTGSFSAQGSPMLTDDKPDHSTVFKHMENLYKGKLDTVQRRGWRVPGVAEVLGAQGGKVGKGYRVWVKRYGAQPVMDNEGMINYGTVNLVDLTSTQELSCSNSPADWCYNSDRGWNLTANPYPCDIDWEAGPAAWAKPATMANAYSRWINAAGISGYGSYVTGGTWIGVTPAPANPRYIPSSQAFFVRLNPTGGSYSETWSITENAKSVATAGTFARSATNEISMLKIKMSKPSMNGTYGYEMGVRFMDQAEDGFDFANDVASLGSEGFFMGMPVENEFLGLNSLAPLTDSKVVPITMNYKGNTGAFELRFSGISTFEPGSNIFLRDKFFNTVHNLRLSDVYTFSVYAIDGSNFTDRFELIFTPSEITSVKDVIGGLSLAVYPNPSLAGKGTTIAMNGFDTESAQLTILDAVGRTVLSKVVSLNPNGPTEFQMTEFLSSGVYTVKTVAGNKSLTRKMVIR